ncbi:MFS transporter [Paenibacillus sp. GP183]|jgi:DHA2 family metal-tetracycline-proton antiporter-like MFS transporter|uniref:MFS transporter n=1 Tax=Paenibacillus sp. GP183 TaxID=1882751 RepID=UPI00089D0C40|nr:MFS transporter [Paenibacillus sp. GP183]SEB56704.1 MFS transporter, DHA2 family, metal-tetracycline-proton antiporter [Paenibacillus sp. GP183]
MSDPSISKSSSSTAQTVLREGLVTFLLGISMVLVIMNTMMFNLALPDVSRSFSISPSATSWIVTGYSIVMAISSITYSRLSDFLPIRRLFIIGLASLGIASIIGFFSNSFVPLLVARLLQASGAGSIPALSLVLVSRYIPMQRRGKAMATVMSAASLGLGLGPVAGGAIVEYMGWHYLFAVTAISLILIPFIVTLIPKEKLAKGTFDALGALFIGIGTTGLLLFLTSQSWLALVAGLAALILFVIRIHRTAEPFVQPALFRNRTYLTLGAVGIAAYLCSFATLFLMPQILVHRFGLSAIASGLVIFPGSLLAMLVSRRVGKIIDRYGNGSIIRYIPLLVLGSVVLFALFVSTSYISILLIYIPLSVGFTFLTSSISNEMSRILPQSQIGSGLGLFQLLQFFSGAFGVAITASALVWQKNLPLSTAYSNIYWGLAIIVLLSIGCSQLYSRFTTRAVAAQES